MSVAKKPALGKVAGGNHLSAQNEEPEPQVGNPDARRARCFEKDATGKNVWHFSRETDLAAKFKALMRKQKAEAEAKKSLHAVTPIRKKGA